MPHDRESRAVMQLEYQRWTTGDAGLLADFLTAGDWPWHAGGRSRDAILAGAASGEYDSGTARTFWITEQGDRTGLIHLWDLADPTPMFDLRVRAADRGRGIGSHALAWLTEYVFSSFPQATRIEATTRQDNVAMRRAMRRAGYVKESHYRDAWAGQGGSVHDAIGYAILRRDWLAGVTTPVRWDDEPA
jgi:RimJ/RimL family protein N-acetyltransferase